MRPLAAVAIWVVLIGGLAFYTYVREEPAPAISDEVEEVRGQFSLRVTATFVQEPDPFALRVDDRHPPSLLVRINGREVVRRTETIAAGAPIVVEQVKGFLEGGNEFYLESNPPLALAGLPQAVRVEVFQNRQLILERCIWAEPGWKVAATFGIRIAPSRELEKHRHG